MKIVLERYYGDRTITKSVMKVYMDGESEPRMTCDAREPKFCNYAFSFAGASSYCLPAGTHKMKCGNSPYSPMGLRVPRCAGHRCVYIGYKWSREYFEGEILVGQPYCVDFLKSAEVLPATEENRDFSHLEKKEETYAQLTELVYEAYGRGEDFTLVIDNSKVKDLTLVSR